jgi:hypothetical protein
MSKPAIVAYVLCSSCAAECVSDSMLYNRSQLLVGAVAGGGLQVWCAIHSTSVVKVEAGGVGRFLADLAAGKYGGQLSGA